MHCQVWGAGCSVTSWELFGNCTHQEGRKRASRVSITGVLKCDGRIPLFLMKNQVQEGWPTCLRTHSRDKAALLPPGWADEAPGWGPLSASPPSWPCWPLQVLILNEVKSIRTQCHPQKGVPVCHTGARFPCKQLQLVIIGLCLHCSPLHGSALSSLELCFAYIPLISGVTDQLCHRQSWASHSTSPR